MFNVSDASMGLACFVWQLTHRQYENDDLKDRNGSSLFGFQSARHIFIIETTQINCLRWRNICCVCLRRSFRRDQSPIARTMRICVTSMIALSHCERTPCAVSIVTNPRRFDLVTVLSCGLGMISNEDCDTTYKTGKEECLHES